MPQVLERLLNAGASLHAVNQDGNTALHLAAHNNHLGAISMLLKWGAKTDMRNNDGLAPVTSPPPLIPTAPNLLLKAPQSQKHFAVGLFID